ncbi:MAG: SCO family protein [Caldilineaceae bacterium]|nr:SCO family protein [Caldilineaceae bacterium]
MQLRKLGLLFAVLTLIGTNACTRRPQLNGTVFEVPTAAYDLTGTNYDGTPFRLSDTRGKITVLFFGYTFCPDVCPFTLADLKQVSAKLGERSSAFAVVFITVDPERDTLDKIKQYVQTFNPAFYGVRVEGEAFEAAKGAFGVYAAKRDAQTGSADSYLVDHTAALYVIDRAGDLREVLPYNAGPDQILPDVEYWLRAG